MRGPTIMSLDMSGFTDPAEPDVPALEPETAAMMIRDGFAKLAEFEQFRPGDFLRFKQGCESGFKPARSGLMVFVGYREIDHQTDSIGPMGVHDLDCVIGKLTDDGALIELPCCSRYLELAPGWNEGRAAARAEITDSLPWLITGGALALIAIAASHWAPAILNLLGFRP